MMYAPKTGVASEDGTYVIGTACAAATAVIVAVVVQFCACGIPDMTEFCAFGIPDMVTFCAFGIPDMVAFCAFGIPDMIAFCTAVVTSGAGVPVTKQAPGSDKDANVVTDFGPKATLIPSRVTAAKANTPASTARVSVSSSSQLASGSKVIDVE